MAHITVIANQKGGVGKSTTASVMADGLMRKNKRVLLIDMDAQGNTSLSFGAKLNLPSVYDVLTKQCDAFAAVQPGINRPDVIASNKKLARLDIELVSIGKEFHLKEQLEPLSFKYDFIIIDTPPALGVLTVNALTAANTVLMPAQADIYSIQGIGQLAETIKAIRTYTNPGLTLAGILLTRHNARNVISRDMADSAQVIATQVGTFLYDTVIREAVAIRESQAIQQSIFDYAPKSNAAIDYMTFIDEYNSKVMPQKSQEK